MESNFPDVNKKKPAQEKRESIQVGKWHSQPQAKLGC